MFAEITVTAAEPLSSSLEAQARAWFGPLAPVHVALERTQLAKLGEKALSIAFAKVMSTHVILVSRAAVNAFSAYVELGNVPPDVKRLKAVAEAAADRLVECLAAHGHRATSLEIGINAEGILLQFGRKHTWAQRLVASARKEIPGRLSVPVATFVASIWFDTDVRRGAVNALAALAGVLVWLVVSVTLEGRGYRYE